jgi:hypothetical protein
VAGAARDPGLHSRRSRGVANSQVRDPNRVAVVDSRMHRAFFLVFSSLDVPVEVDVDVSKRCDLS